jgi:hypothetical protein
MEREESEVQLELMALVPPILTCNVKSKDPKFFPKTIGFAPPPWGLFPLFMETEPECITN